ncbi:hypothetical protein [Minwuia sp.]|uniref:hypothetical protein n=1 Tax=Minwuia sp. TaxID=2493630 RepID=UPI003A8E76E5
MKSIEDIENLEKTIGQLKAVHGEMSLLSKKSQNDAVNKFKLGMINKVIASANSVLGSEYRPFDDFEAFDVDELPSNSDVVFVIAQYLEEIERFRTDNIVNHDYKWVYLIEGKPSEILADAKTRGRG